MGTRTIRLGYNMNFDEGREGDIIEFVDRLARSRSLGKFIEGMLRHLVATEEGSAEADKIIKEQLGLGIKASGERAKFIKNISDEIASMKKKVDALYDMNVQMMAMARFNSRFGLEKRAENSLIAQFLIERQLNALSSLLGVTREYIYKSDKVADVKELAETVLAYIAEHHEGVVNEIRQSATVIAEREGTVQVKQDSVIEAIEPRTSVPEEPEYIEVEDEDDVVDFGGADFDMLSSFLGGR